MRTAAFLIFALPLLAQDPARGVNFYTYEKEQALGRQLADEYLRQATLIESPELLARIEAMARGLIPANSKHTYSFALVADEGLVRNEPIAFPGGFIFIPSGLILHSPDSATVAAMLAHAIAHVEARHGSKAITRGEIVNQATMPLIFMGGWNGFAVRQNASMAVPLGFQKMRAQFEAQADELGAGYVQANTRPLPDLREMQELLRRALPEKAKTPPRLSR